MTRKHRATVTVNGWNFATYVDPKHLPEWKAAGVQIYLVENIVPLWVAQLGLTRPWCAVQDLWRGLG